MPLQDANATLSFGGFRLRERSDDPVLVVKGEKTSDAVRALIPSSSPITSMGEGAAPERLEAPEVVVWPDNDPTADDMPERMRLWSTRRAHQGPVLCSWLRACPPIGTWPIPFPGV